MPITFGGSARRRVVERDSGAGAVAGSAHGSIARAREPAVARDSGAGAAGESIARRCVVERDSGAGAAAGSAHGSTARGRVVDRDSGAGVVAGSAQGSIVVAGRRGCVAPADGVLGAAGRGDVAGGVDSDVRGDADGTDRVGALGGAASLPGAGAAGGVAFTRAARAAGLLASKAGGSVGFLTWSGAAVESAGPVVFAGGEIGSPLCARAGVTPTATRLAPAKMADRSPTRKPKTRLHIIRPTWAGKIRRAPLAYAMCPR